MATTCARASRAVAGTRRRPFPKMRRMKLSPILVFLVRPCRRRPGAAGPTSRADPRDRHARRPGARPGLRASALRQPRRAEGRPPGAGLSRRVRQPQSLQRQGLVDGAGPGRQRLPVADDAFGRRALHALRPYRPVDRDRRRARPSRLPSQSGGAFLRRREDRRRRRPFHLQPPEDQRPSVAASRLRAW